MPAESPAVSHTHTNNAGQQAWKCATLTVQHTNGVIGVVGRLPCAVPCAEESLAVTPWRALAMRHVLTPFLLFSAHSYHPCSLKIGCSFFGGMPVPSFEVHHRDCAVCIRGHWSSGALREWFCVEKNTLRRVCYLSWRLVWYGVIARRAEQRAPGGVTRVDS